MDRSSTTACSHRRACRPSTVDRRPGTVGATGRATRSRPRRTHRRRAGTRPGRRAGSVAGTGELPIGCHPVPAGESTDRRDDPPHLRVRSTAFRAGSAAVQAGGAIQAPPEFGVADGSDRLGRAISGRDGPGHDPGHQLDPDSAPLRAYPEEAVHTGMVADSWGGMKGLLPGLLEFMRQP